MHQHLVFRTREQARAITRGSVHLVCCPTCGFVFNSAFDLSRLHYGAAYDNSQVSSPFFSAYLHDLIRNLVEQRGVQNCRIVEVGCGDGQFLRDLVAAAGPQSSGYGFDPSYRGPLEDQDGQLHFERSYYGPDQAHIPADIVVCRHVIEHVPDPISLLQTIRQALHVSPGARVFFETPTIEWSLRNQVVWDIFYEHCSYFSKNSLATAFTLTGFHVEEVRHVFGGQYLWIEATAIPEAEQPIFQGQNITHLAQKFTAVEHDIVHTWRERVQQLARLGPVALWGAGAKGATLAHLVDPDDQIITCIVDLNPNKQGGFLPGTGHPIVDYRRLNELGVRSALLMNPNYRSENEQLLRAAGLNVALVDL